MHWPSAENKDIRLLYIYFAVMYVGFTIPLYKDHHILTTLILYIVPTLGPSQTNQELYAYSTKRACSIHSSCIKPYLLHHACGEVALYSLLAIYQAPLTLCIIQMLLME